MRIVFECVKSTLAKGLTGHKPSEALSQWRFDRFLGHVHVLGNLNRFNRIQHSLDSVRLG